MKATEPTSIDISDERMTAYQKQDRINVINEHVASPVGKWKVIIRRGNHKIGIKGNARVYWVIFSIRDRNLDNRGTADRSHVRGQDEPGKSSGLHRCNSDRGTPDFKLCIEASEKETVGFGAIPWCSRDPKIEIMA
jgi:hypothetical protein